MDVSLGTTISSVSATVGVVLVAWLAYKIAKLAKAVEEVRHNTNSLTQQLVAKTEKSSHAEGRLEAQHEAAAVGAKPPVITPPPAP